MKPTQKKTSFLNFFRWFLRNTLAETCLIPMTRGKNWTHWLARIPANYYQYKKGSVRNVNRNGFKMRLDISDYMQWLLYFGIETEPRDKLYSLVKKDMTIVDIGANIGETSMAFSRIAGPKGKIYSFEPDSNTFLHLEQHLHENNCNNVICVQTALGDKAGKLFLGHNEHNTAGNRISTESGKEIVVDTADNYFSKNPPERIDFIKIDVEGFELRVILGALATIKRYKPLLFCEAVDEFLRIQGSSTQELVALLEKLNYKLTNAYDGNEITSSQIFEGTHFDIIGTPQ